MMVARRQPLAGPADANVAALIASIPGGRAVLDYLLGEVKRSAKSAVMPYAMGAIAASGMALAFSLVAALRSR